MTMTTAYWWWIAGVLLIGAEVALPGVFLLWIGIAAVVMGGVVWLVPDLASVYQAILFTLLAFASCFGYWKLLRPNRYGPHGAERHLNRRAEQHLGKRYTLETAIRNGLGKARVGDGLWTVEGPDLPAGSLVEVIGVDGTRLRVRAPLAE